MKKATAIPLFFSIILLAACSETNNPVIKLGKSIDKTKQKVTGETNAFTRNDTFAYSLRYVKPFGVDILNRRLYKGKNYIDLILKESKDIKVDPAAKITGDSIPARDIVNKYGTGDFWLLFVVREKVVAKTAFSIGEEQIINNNYYKKAPEKKAVIKVDIITDNQAKKEEVKPKKPAITAEIIPASAKPTGQLIPNKPVRDMASPSEMMGKD